MTLQLHVDYLCLTCVYGINFLSISWVLRLQYMCNTLNSTLSCNIFYCLDQTECESARSNELGEPFEVWSIWIHGTFTCRKLIIYFISFYVLKLLCCSCRLLSKPSILPYLTLELVERRTFFTAVDVTCA